jgi:hypothetical protein
LWSLLCMCLCVRVCMCLSALMHTSMMPSANDLISKWSQYDAWFKMTSVTDLNMMLEWHQLQIWICCLGQHYISYWSEYAARAKQNVKTWQWPNWVPLTHTLDSSSSQILSTISSRDSPPPPPPPLGMVSKMVTTASCTYVCLSVYMCVCVCVFIYMCVCVYMCVCNYIYMCVC